MFAVDPSPLLASDPLLPRDTNTNSSFHPSTLAKKKKKKKKKLTICGENFLHSIVKSVLDLTLLATYISLT